MKTTITIEEQKGRTIITMKRGRKTKTCNTSNANQIAFYSALMKCVFDA